MNVLWIDYLSHRGHINFNRIHLHALESLGNVSVDMVCRDIHVKHYKHFCKQIVQVIPSYMYHRGPIAARISYIFIQLFLWIKICFRKYDAVIFSSYDTTTFWLMPYLMNRHVFLIDHNNIGEIDKSKIKLTMMKLIQRNITHIVFNDYMKQFMISKGIKRVELIPHGIISDVLHINNETNIIFCPSSTSSDKNFVKSLMRSDEFSDFLENEQYVFYVKGSYKDILPKSNRIKIIATYLTDEEYRSLFLRSKIILLPYINTFRYRCSGVMFECFAFRKYCLLPNTDNFRAYKQLFRYDPFFEKTIPSFLQILSQLIKQEKDISPKYNNLSTQYPESYWHTLLNRKN